jgi:hypothetical protein
LIREAETFMSDIKDFLYLMELHTDVDIATVTNMDIDVDTGLLLT